ncbi:hypothetical protein TNCV_3216231 [Trichonephila clavipes]|nr:hypothetical protein TNCV_3216231 [Trichonephila clavipes]
MSFPPNFSYNVLKWIFQNNEQRPGHLKRPGGYRFLNPLAAHPAISTGNVDVAKFVQPAISAGVSRFTVSGLFSTNIFRQIPSTVSNLEQCDPKEHPLGIYVAPLPPERPSLE